MAQRTLIVGISGASSSGKTTLARLLRDVWSNTIILHEDDFYWPDDKIPIKNGVQDWDCIEALDVHRLEQTLIYLRTHGSLPPGLKSKEDKNSAGESGVHQSTINQWRSRVDALVASRPTRSMAIIEGFLLYSQKMESIWKLFDVKLFLHTNYTTAKSRREARDGYVTLEGFWEDPPGYVDKVVWPNYLEEHAFIFENGDVEAPPREDVCRQMGLHMKRGAPHDDMTSCLAWACDILHSRLEHVGD